MSALTPSQTQELLNKIGHRPKKKLGQNFLIDRNIVRKSIDFAKVSEGDTVIEVGPGLGTLTGALLEQKAQVYAVELDPTLAEHIRNRFGGDIDLKEGDATKYPVGNFDFKSDYKIVANLPYAISSIWLDKILSAGLPLTMVLMLQKEAADRFCAEHGGKSFGGISIFLQSAYEVKGLHKVSSKCFYPAPQIDSVLIHLERRSNPYVFCEEAKTFIKHLFSQRRKQIGALCKKSEYSKVLEGWLSDVGYEKRAEAISIENWQKLNEIFIAK